jgi:hypothetical protein
MFWRITDQIDAAMILTRSDLINVHIHFLRNAAASFLTTHCSSTQISHSAIRNPTTVSKSPMNSQKDPGLPEIYDNTCAIAKGTS